MKRQSDHIGNVRLRIFLTIFNMIMALIEKVYNMQEQCKQRDGNSKNQKEILEIKKTGKGLE